MYDFRGEDTPASWLKRETGPAEHLRAQAEEGQGDNSQSEEAETPGDKFGEFGARQDPEVDSEENSRAVESGEDEILPYRHSRHQIRVPNKLNLRVKAGTLDGFSIR